LLLIIVEGIGCMTNNCVRLITRLPWMDGNTSVVSLTAGIINSRQQGINIFINIYNTPQFASVGWGWRRERIILRILELLGELSI